MNHISDPPEVDASARVHAELGDEGVLKMYEDMLLIRRFEERAGRAYQQGKIKGFCHLYIGQEAVAVGSMHALKSRDYIVSHYREHGHALARGMSANTVMAELFGKVTGCSSGKGGSMHLFDTNLRFYGGWGIVGGHIPTAAGLAFASKYRDEDAVCMCYMGDGAIHQGAFHETLNMAQLWNLPAVFVCENNGYAMGTSVERASSVLDLEVKALAYGMNHATFDGQNIFTCYEGMKHAIDHARAKSQPSFLDVKTYRYRGHSMSDPAKYRTKDEVKTEQERDSIQTLHNWLVDKGIRSDESLGTLDANIKQVVKDAEAFAEQSEPPHVSALLQDVYVSWDSDYEGSEL